MDRTIDIESISEQLTSSSTAKSLIYQHPLNHPLPDREMLKAIVNNLRQCLFPGFYGKSPHKISWKSIIANLLDSTLPLLSEQI